MGLWYPKRLPPRDWPDYGYLLSAVNGTEFKAFAGGYSTGSAADKRALSRARSYARVVARQHLVVVHISRIERGDQWSVDDVSPYRRS